jgi:methylmalonyl-CoA mutase N-terminal domain/subunit
VESGEQDRSGRKPLPDGRRQSDPHFRLDPALEQAQIERLRQLKASRNQTEVAESLNHLEQSAHGDGNLLPKILTPPAPTRQSAKYPTAFEQSSANIAKPCRTGILACGAGWNPAAD